MHKNCLCIKIYVVHIMKHCQRNYSEKKKLADKIKIQGKVRKKKGKIT